MDRIKKHSKRLAIGVSGVLVVLIGLVLVPYPGPGWLVVFAGFAILSTEFEFAAKALVRLKHAYGLWTDWLQRQNRIVQASVIAITGLFVFVTIYLLNTFGIINQIFQLHQPWLISPFFK